MGLKKKTAMRHYTPAILGILTVLFAPCCQKESARGEAPVTEINLSIPGTKVALGAKDALSIGRAATA